MSPIIYRGKRADYTAYNFKPLEHPLSGWNLFASQFPILTCVFASRSPKKDTLEKFKWFNSCRNLDWWSINLHENCMGSSVSVGWQWSDFLLWLWKHKCNKRFFSLRTDKLRIFTPQHFDWMWLLLYNWISIVFKCDLNNQI